ncbi:hypothetical protein GCM10018793_64610 [Streptomyces sulfonofaciens]|uniref:Uncharacterized protein n=1 Tax=Streptomyces sulfonofaciens TaxID=68272 RepID=A0A919GN75_9ACTN|nr:hypothetical protein GCM10018793_64610 [Streptomyces sulfonofaciens]
MRPSDAVPDRPAPVDHATGAGRGTGPATGGRPRAPGSRVPSPLPRAGRHPSTTGRPRTGDRVRTAGRVGAGGRAGTRGRTGAPLLDGGGDGDGDGAYGAAGTASGTPIET